MAASAPPTPDVEEAQTWTAREREEIDRLLESDSIEQRAKSSKELTMLLDAQDVGMDKAVTRHCQREVSEYVADRPDADIGGARQAELLHDCEYDARTWFSRSHHAGLHTIDTFSFEDGYGIAAPDMLKMDAKAYFAPCSKKKRIEEIEHAHSAEFTYSFRGSDGGQGDIKAGQALPLNALMAEVLEDLKELEKSCQDRRQSILTDAIPDQTQRRAFVAKVLEHEDLRWQNPSIVLLRPVNVWSFAQKSSEHLMKGGYRECEEFLLFDESDLEHHDQIHCEDDKIRYKTTPPSLKAIEQMYSYNQLKDGYDLGGLEFGEVDKKSVVAFALTLKERTSNHERAYREGSSGWTRFYDDTGAFLFSFSFNTYA